MNTYIRTYTGRMFFPAQPKKEDVCIEDVAHHLSQLCRFTGGTRRFYSVAEHSIYAYKMIRLQTPGNFRLQKAALLHDAAEAYYGDISRPLKYLPDMEPYRTLLKWGEAVVADAFDLLVAIPPMDLTVPLTDDAYIKLVDNYLGKKELALFMNGSEERTLAGNPDVVDLTPELQLLLDPAESPAQVEQRFLNIYFELEERLKK